MQEHPEQVPAWAPKLEPWQIIALGRYIIWGWPEGEAGGDLQRGGIEPDPVAYHGSNEMLLAPSRTAMHAPIAVVDPHLSWYGEFRFYEMRIYGGELSFSGAAILGLPFPSLGHNRYLSVAMTTGGPDTSDAYEEEVQDGKYQFKDEWRPLEVRTERIGVKEGSEMKWQDVRIESTHPRADRGAQERQGLFAGDSLRERIPAAGHRRGGWPRRTIWRRRRQALAGCS